MKNKDNVSSNKLNLSDKSKKLNVKKILLVIAVLTILLLLLLVLFNKYIVNKYSFRGMDLYCESIYTKPYLNKKRVYCDMVAKNNGDMTMYLKDYWQGPVIVVEPGAEVSFTSLTIEHPNKPDTLYVGKIEMYDAKIPCSNEHMIHTFRYSIEHVGDTYTWKPDIY